MPKEFWGCNGCDHSKYDEFCTECGTCVNGSNYEKSCCSMCDGCDNAEYRETEWYCKECEVPCDEIRKCPWSV